MISAVKAVVPVVFLWAGAAAAASAASQQCIDPSNLELKASLFVNARTTNEFSETLFCSVVPAVGDAGEKFPYSQAELINVGQPECTFKGSDLSSHWGEVVTNIYPDLTEASKAGSLSDPLRGLLEIETKVEDSSLRITADGRRKANVAVLVTSDALPSAASKAAAAAGCGSETADGYATLLKKLADNLLVVVFASNDVSDSYKSLASSVSNLKVVPFDPSLNNISEEADEIFRQLACHIVDDDTNWCTEKGKTADCPVITTTTTTEPTTGSTVPVVAIAAASAGAVGLLAALGLGLSKRSSPLVSGDDDFDAEGFTTDEYGREVQEGYNPNDYA